MDTLKFAYSRLPDWARKAVTDSIEGTIAVFGTVNVAAFLAFVTVTAQGVQFDKAGALDYGVVLAGSVALGVAHAVVSAVRRQLPAARLWLEDKLATILD